MWVKFVGRYSSKVGSWPEGKIADVDEAVFAYIERDSPGVCERWDIETNSPARDEGEGIRDESPSPLPDEEITEETASGIEAQDRRARGGSKRS